MKSLSRVVWSEGMYLGPHHFQTQSRYFEDSIHFAVEQCWFEPWGVVVNEAAACGLPLVLSDRVGAARDLLRDGENGALVPAGDAGTAADALSRLASDPGVRERMGARSRELVRGFGYEPSVDNLLAAVREATASR